MVKGLAKLEGKRVQAATITPHDWVGVVDFRLREGTAEEQSALACLIVSQFFGWRASSVMTLLTTDVEPGPYERDFPTLRFSTRKFKASEFYPVGQFIISKRVDIMHFLATYVRHAKVSRPEGPLFVHKGAAASSMVKAISILNKKYMLNLPLESHAVRRGTASCLAAMRY